VFAHAPPSVVVGDLLAVPIHIRALRASVVLDARNRRGHVDAHMHYRVGPRSGCPLFDLRQSIDHAWLDGRPIATARLRPRDVGEGPSATVRVVDLPQSAGSTHMLRLGYRLAQPHSDLGGAYPPVLSGRGHGRLRWSFGMGDLFDGRHLEMWFPSNLPFDQFPFELALTVAGAAANHTLVSNGAVTARGPHSWLIRFPAWFSSGSPMLELRPTDELDHAQAEVILGRSGRRVVIDAWKPRGRPENLAREAALIGQMLDANEAMFGPFPAQRYTCFFHGAQGGMEYAGGTTTSSGALAHEVLHSWFARGVMPASDADGWWDEAFTTFATSGAPVMPLDFDRPPIRLCSRRPFQRHTHAEAYVEGSRLFSGIAEMTGRTSLMRSMRALFEARGRTCLSTAELEQHLVVGTGAVGIVDAFHRFVYGLADPRGGSGVRFDRLWVSDGSDGPWINAQVSNDRDADVCRHFLLVFSTAAIGRGEERSRGPAHLAAIAGFDLRPGQARTVRVPVPIGAGRPDGHAPGIEVIGGVHVRLFHPSGRAVDYRERTMMRAGVPRAAGARDPVPAVRSAG
jgi:hypothetical protein